MSNSIVRAIVLCFGVASVIVMTLWAPFKITVQRENSSLSSDFVLEAPRVFTNSNQTETNSTTNQTENVTLYRDILKDYEGQIVSDISTVNAADLMPNDADKSKFLGAGYNLGDLLNMPTYSMSWNTTFQKWRHVWIRENMPTSIVGQYYTFRNPNMASGALPPCNLDPDVGRIRQAFAASEAKNRVNPLQLRALQQQDTITIHLRSGDRSGQSDSFASEVLKVARQLNCLHSKPCRLVVMTWLHAHRKTLTKKAIKRMRGDLVLFESSLRKRHINATVEFWRGGSRRTDDDLFLMAMASHLIVHHGGFSALGGILSHGVVYFSSRMAPFSTNPHYMMQIRHIGFAFQRSLIHLTLDRALNYTPSCCEFRDGLCTNALSSMGCWVWTFIGNSLQDKKNCHVVAFNCSNAQLKSKEGSPKLQSCFETFLDTYLEKVKYFELSPRALYVDGNFAKEAVELINFAAVPVHLDGRIIDASPQQVNIQMPTKQSEAIIGFAENLQRLNYVLVRRQDVSETTNLTFLKQTLLPL